MFLNHQRFEHEEVKKAKLAAEKYGHQDSTIFSKIIDKSIPADIIYEDYLVSTHNFVAFSCFNYTF